MRLLLALIAPCLAFFLAGWPITGVICLVLQFTLIGWVPAALWAVYCLRKPAAAHAATVSMRRSAH